ncbi:MAG: hypothetical protein ACP5GJ_00140 [Nanopusillaceae archaeon]|jgi:FlaA1/EpsC-like NDP-sugar epimerase
MDVASFIYLLFSEYGIFTIIAPFLLIFSLTYGLLRKTNLFGKDNPAKEKLYGIIALAISFYYIYDLGGVIFTQHFLSFFFFEVLVLFFILMIISLFGIISKPYESKDPLYQKYKNTAYNSLVGILGLLVLFAFMYASSQSFNLFGQSSANILSMILTILINTGLLPVIIIIGILIGIIYWIIHPGSPNTKKKTKYIIIGAGESPYQLVEQISKK